MKDLKSQVAASEDAMTNVTEQQGLPANDGIKISKDKGKWPPRIVVALTLWYMGRLEELGKLFNSWYYSFHGLKSLVDKGLQKTSF